MAHSMVRSMDYYTEVNFDYNMDNNLEQNFHIQIISFHLFIIIVFIFRIISDVDSSLYYLLDIFSNEKYFYVFLHPKMLILFILGIQYYGLQLKFLDSIHCNINIKYIYFDKIIHVNLNLLILFILRTKDIRHNLRISLRNYLDLIIKKII